MAGASTRQWLLDASEYAAGSRSLPNWPRWARSRTQSAPAPMNASASTPR